MVHPPALRRQSRVGPDLRAPDKYIPRVSDAFQIFTASPQVGYKMPTFQSLCGLSETAFIILRCSPSVVPFTVSLRRHLYLNGSG